MDENKKLLSYLAGVLVSFIIAALFQYVFGVGVGIAVTICALTNLVFLAGPQSINRRMPVPGRIFFLAVALIVGFVFALMFFSTWTLLAIYLVAITAVSVINIARV